MKTNVQSAGNPSRPRNEDQQAFLDRRVRLIISDAVKGRYVYKRKENEPGTGRPWVQTALMEVDGIRGWSAIDAFDDQNVEFAALTGQAVRVAHGLKQGIFVSTETIPAGEIRAEYLTHHIQNATSLDRLKADLAEKFDLSLFFLWEGQEIIMSVLPNCRSFQIMSQATEQRGQCVVHRLGTENNLRHAATHGLNLKNGKTRFLRRLTPEYIDHLQEHGKTFLGEYLKATFDNGITWGWAKHHADPESPVDMDMSKMFRGNGPLLPFDEMENRAEPLDTTRETVETGKPVLV